MREESGTGTLYSSSRPTMTLLLAECKHSVRFLLVFFVTNFYLYVLIGTLSDKTSAFNRYMKDGF